MPVMQADEVLAKYWDGNLPVNVGAIAAALGIQAEQASLPADTHGVIEKTEDGVIRARTNINEPFPRQRFTLAHEIGHYCLGHLTEPGQKFRDSLNRMENTRDPQEVSANRFAAELLMPERAVSYVMKKGLASSLDEMASEFFGVSRQAMGIRLEVLGLL